MNRCSNLILLITLSISNFCLAQDVDTLLTVPLSRVQYCNAKVEEVQVLTSRVNNRDQEITLANQRVDNKQKEIETWKEQFNSAVKQRDINQEKLNIKDKLLSDSESKNKSLKDQNLVLKIGGVVLIVLALMI